MMVLRHMHLSITIVINYDTLLPYLLHQIITKSIIKVYDTNMVAKRPSSMGEEKAETNFNASDISEQV